MTHHTAPLREGDDPIPWLRCELPMVRNGSCLCCRTCGETTGCS